MADAQIDINTAVSPADTSDLLCEICASVDRVWVPIEFKTGCEGGTAAHLTVLDRSLSSFEAAAESNLKEIETSDG